MIVSQARADLEVSLPCVPQIEEREESERQHHDEPVVRVVREARDLEGEIGNASDGSGQAQAGCRQRQHHGADAQRGDGDREDDRVGFDASDSGVEQRPVRALRRRVDEEQVEQRARIGFVLVRSAATGEVEPVSRARSGGRAGVPHPQSRAQIADPPA